MVLARHWRETGSRMVFEQVFELDVGRAGRVEEFVQASMDGVSAIGTICGLKLTLASRFRFLRPGAEWG